MPPPFTYGPSPCRIRLLVGQGSVCGRRPPDAVIPDTAEWCYPAQALKWRRVCPDEACMSLALPAAGRHALQRRTSRSHLPPPAPEPLAHSPARHPARAVDPSGRLGYGPRSRCRVIPASGQGGAMPVQNNKQAARRFYQEVINGRNLDAMDELLTSDGVDHTFGSHSAEQAKQFFSIIHPALPERHTEVQDVIAEGELVAARVTYTGTHQGEFVGIPATGKRTTISGVDFFRMQDGRQAEHWGGPDMFSFLVQAGVMPGPGTPGPGTPA